MEWKGIGTKLFFIVCSCFLLCVNQHLQAATSICHSGGCTTYTSTNSTPISVSAGYATFNTGGSPNNGTISISGGTANFEASWSMGNSITVNQCGGTSIFTSTFPNGSTFNLSGGSMEINAINNNADINVTGGTLLLGSNFSLGSGTLELGPGTLQTNGESIAEFNSITLTGDATIDLTGGSCEVLDFSACGFFSVCGCFTLDLVGWDSCDTITFACPLPGGFSVTVDGAPATFAAGVVNGSVVPEASTVTAMLGLLGLVGWHASRRRKKRIHAG